MRCPICGAKMVNKQLCQYCNITDEQVFNASNRKVKFERRLGNHDLIHYTNVLPKDINKLKLWLYTIFLGLVGVHSFYVLRPIKGKFSAWSTGLSFGILIIRLFVKFHSDFMNNVIWYLYYFFFLMMAINVVMWISDIIGLLFRLFKVPVVLGEKEVTRG